MYVCIFLFEYAPLLRNNTTCFKSTCYRTSVLTHGIVMPIREGGRSSTESYTNRHYGGITGVSITPSYAKKHCHQVIRNELPTYRIHGSSGPNGKSRDTFVKFATTNFY